MTAAPVTKEKPSVYNKGASNAPIARPMECAAPANDKVVARALGITSVIKGMIPTIVNSNVI